MAVIVNRGFLSGRLTADPKISYLPNGKPKAEFSLCQNIPATKDGQKVEEPHYFDCSCFERNAEHVGNYLRKGSNVIVEYALRFRSWEKDGVKHRRTTLNVYSVQFLDKPAAREEAAPDDEPL